MAEGSPPSGGRNGTLDEPKPSSVRAMVAVWLDWLDHERRLSPATLKAYASDCEDLIGFVTRHRGEEVDLATFASLDVTSFRSWLAARHQRRVSARSNARALAAVRSLFRFMERRYGLENPGIDRVKARHKVRRLPKALSEDDALHMVSSISADREEIWIQKRDQSLLALLYGSGLRIGEALALDRRDWKSGATGQLRVVGKGNKERAVPVLPLVARLIEAYLDICPLHGDGLGDRPLFLGVRGKRLNGAVFRKTLADWRRSLGVTEHATPHAFRHSFATHLLTRGADLREVQELLGHASVSTTQIYTQLDTDHLGDLFRRTHPRA